MDHIEESGGVERQEGQPPKCPNADTRLHAVVAESLGISSGTLLFDDAGWYCPACDYKAPS
jgi:hypothetical protein